MKKGFRERHSVRILVSNKADPLLVQVDAEPFPTTKEIAKVSNTKVQLVLTQ